MPNTTRIIIGPGVGYHFRTSALDDWSLGKKVIYDPIGRPMAACQHAADALEIVRALNAWHASDWQAAPLVAEAAEGEDEDEEEEEDVVQASWSVA